LRLPDRPARSHRSAAARGNSTPKVRRRQWPVGRICVVIDLPYLFSFQTLTGKFSPLLRYFPFSILTRRRCSSTIHSNLTVSPELNSPIFARISRSRLL